MSQSSRATFDVLLLHREADRGRNGLLGAEIHTLAYLACLLSVFDQRSPEWWGYDFVSTRVGVPFASALHSAVENAVAAAWLASDGRVTTLSEYGAQIVDSLSDLSSNSAHVRYLEVACSATLTFPLPLLGEILCREPQLLRLASRGSTRELLDDIGVALLVPQFNTLRDALGRTSEPPGASDPTVPMFVWLSYLMEEEEVSAGTG